MIGNGLENGLRLNYKNYKDMIYYIWEDGLTHDFHGMKKEEYDRVIWDARKKMTFYRRDGFETIEEVADYVRKYFNVEPTIIER